MIDEKSIPPPNPPMDSPPAYPNASQHFAGSSSQPHSQQPPSPGYPQAARSPGAPYTPPMGSSPQVQSPGQNGQYPNVNPYPQPNYGQPQPQMQSMPPQFAPGSLQQMQMDAQIGSQFQQQLYARCARGDHDAVTKYGICGIITAVLLFPIGLVCLFLDTDRKCSRCGTTLP